MSPDKAGADGSVGQLALCLRGRSDLRSSSSACGHWRGGCLLVLDRGGEFPLLIIDGQADSQYKYQLLYVYVSRAESGGRMWNVYVNRLIGCAFLMQLLMVLSKPNSAPSDSC